MSTNTPAVSDQVGDGPPSSRSSAVRGLAIGVAVAIALLAMWVPATTCEGEGFSCLGWVVVTIFATPVVAFLVALAAGAVLGMRRPWLLALLGPFAAFGVLRTTFAVLGPGLSALLVSALLIALSYLAITLLLRPGTSLIVRAATAVVVAAMIFLPGSLDDDVITRRESAQLREVAVPVGWWR